MVRRASPVRHDGGAARADPGQSRRSRAPMAATPSTSADSPPTASRCWDGCRRRATACSRLPPASPKTSRPGMPITQASSTCWTRMSNSTASICPTDPAARAVLADPPCVTEPIRRLDLGKEDIHAVIWATGYGVDFGWIDLPVRDAQRRTGPPRWRRPTCRGSISSACPICRNCIPPSCPASATMPPCSPITSPPAAEVPRLPEKYAGDVNPFTSAVAKPWSDQARMIAGAIGSRGVQP